MRYSFRLLGFVAIFFLGINLQANTVSQGGNAVSDGNTLNRCASTNLTFTVGFTANGANKSDSLRIYQGSSLLTTIKSPNTSFNLLVPSSPGSSQQYSIAFYEIASGNVKDSLAFTLSAYSNASVSIPAGQSQTVCYNGTPTGTLTATPSNGSGNFTYRWLQATNASMTGASVIAGQNISTLSLNSIGVLQGGADVFVQAELTDVDCGNVVVSTNTYQIITDDQLQVSIPTATLNVCFGSTPTGTVSASISGGSSNSPNYTYTWYQASNSAMTGKTAIAGQTTANLDLTALGQLNGGSDIYLQVEVSESNCTETALSSQTYQLITHEDLTVSMPAGSQQVCYNESATGNITMTAGGGQQPANYSYTWLSANNASMTGATVISGANSASLNLSTLGPQLGGNDVYIQGQVTDLSCGTVKTTTNLYQLITRDQLTVSLPSAPSQEVCYNGTPTGIIILSAGGGSSAANYVYSWLEADNPSMTNATAISGQTSSSFDLSNLGVQQGGPDIYVQARVFDNSCSQTAVSSNVYHIIVNEQLQVSIPNNTIDVCFGSTPSGTVNASIQGGAVSPSFTYTWFQANNSAMTGKTAIAGQNGSSLNLSALGQQNGGNDIFIQVTVNESVCGESVSSSETYQLITHEDLTVSMPAGTQDVCYNTSASGTITMTPGGGQLPANYSYSWWQASNASMTNATQISGANLATFDLSSLGNLLGGNDVYIQGRVTDVNCGTIKSTANLYHLVTFDQLTVSIPSGQSQDVCYLGTPTGTISSTGGGGSSAGNYVYSWLEADNPAMTGATVISGQNTSTLSLNALGQQLGGADVYVQARVFDNSCAQTAVSSATYHVITRDQLQISIPTQTVDVCFGTTPSGTVSASVSGGDLPANHTYVWYQANNSAMTGKTVITGQSSTSLNLNSLGLQNGGADIYLQAEVTDNTCSQTALSSEVYHLVTHENLQVSASFGTGSEEVCYNDLAAGSLSMTPSAGRQPSNYSYRWLQANNPSMTGATAISGETNASINLSTLGNLTGGADIYIQGEVTDVFCSDVQTTASVYHIITWDQLSATAITNVGGSSTNATVCHLDPLAFDLELAYSGGDTNDSYTFTWEFSSTPNFASIDSNLVRSNTTILSATDIGVFTDTTYIRCVVSDNCGDNATSQTFIVNVWDELIAADSRFANGTATNTDLCFGQALADDLEVDFSGGDLTGSNSFKWERASDANFNTIVQTFPISTSPTLSSTDIDTLQSSAYFRCTVYDDCGDSSISNSFDVLVYPEFLPGDLTNSYNGSQNDSMRVCFGDPINIIRTTGASGADPGTYSYFLEYKLDHEANSAYQDFPLSAAEANSYTLDSSEVLLSPGIYNVRQRIEANCNPVYTEAITIFVNEPPYWGRFIDDYVDLSFQPLDPDLDDSTGALLLCEGQKNVLLKLNQEEYTNYNYQFSSGSALNSVLGARTIVSWNVNSANPLGLAIDYSSNGKNCDRELFVDPNAIAAGTSPDDDQLAAVNTIIVDSDPDVTATYFRWGRINKNSLAWEYVSTWDTARFFDYGSIDTTQYVYVMAAADERGSKCRSYSYYPANFWLNPSKSNTIGQQEELAFETIAIYPNPNSGRFKLAMDEREEVERIEAFDLMGKVIPLHWDPDQKQVSLRQHVPGYVILKVQTQHQVATFKILVQ